MGIATTSLRLVRVCALGVLLSAATVGTAAAGDDGRDEESKSREKKDEQAQCLGVDSITFDTITFDETRCVGGKRLQEQDSDSLRPDGERDEEDAT